MRKVFLFFIAIYCQNIYSQELFVITDPASNVPANSLGVNVMQSLFKEEMKSGYNYHFMPEVSYGLNKNIMFRASAFVSNRNSQLVTEGGSFYTKYRFYSTDDLNSHFRLAAYGRYSFNNADIHQEQIEMTLLYGFRIALCCSFFNSKPIGSIMQHSMNIFGL